MSTNPSATSSSSTTQSPAVPGSPRVSNLFYFTLPAPDLERSKTFYSKVLGWVVDGGSLGGHVSNVTPAGGLNPTSSPDQRHIYMTVDDIDTAIAKVLELGGEADAIERYDTGAAASCRDDQGTRFTLQEASGEYAEYAASPTKGSKHGDLFYFSIPVPDGELGRRFYSRLFGWTFGEQGSHGGMHAENMITDGGIGAGRAGTWPEFWFRVDDINAAVVAVREAGGTASEPMDTPQGPVSDCNDDQGVSFGLAQPAPGT